MDESDHHLLGAGARSLVDQADAFLFGFSQAGGHVVGGESQVVDALTAFLDESGDGALRAGGLEEFEFGLADLEESGLDFLVSDFFDGVALQTENVFIIGDSLFQRVDRDSEVFDVCEIHDIGY